MKPNDLELLAFLGLGASVVFVAYHTFNKNKIQPGPHPVGSKHTPFGLAATVASTHTFDLAKAAPQLSMPGGSITTATADNVPMFEVPTYERLNNYPVSMGMIRLNPAGVEEPHWHPNASELMYCISGTGAMTIFLGDPTVVHNSFTLSAGDLAFIPKGFSHHVENIGTSQYSAVMCWNNERVQTQGLSGNASAMSGRVMDATLGTKSFFKTVDKQTNTLDVGIGKKAATGLDPSIKMVNTPAGSGTRVLPAAVKKPTSSATKKKAKPRPLPPPTIPIYNPIGRYRFGPTRAAYAAAATVPTTTRRPAASPVAAKPTPTPSGPTISNTSIFKFALVKAPAAVLTAGGSDTKGYSGSFPILKGQGLACFSIFLNPGGIREPHWHPNAGEIHHVLRGQMAFAVVSPGGAVDSGTIGPGSFFYAPPAFTHYFENRSTTETLHIVAFFTNDNPSDVGFSGMFGAYSNSVLGATFNTPASSFNSLNKNRLQKDVGITK